MNIDDLVIRTLVHAEPPQLASVSRFEPSSNPLRPKLKRGYQLYYGMDERGSMAWHMTCISWSKSIAKPYYERHTVGEAQARKWIKRFLKDIRIVPM